MSDSRRLSGLKVMVIDDSNTIRRSAEIFLKQAGCEVILADDGFEALSKVADHEPHLIFCDILMPRLDGYQTCALIKKSPRYRDIPVVMLSSRDGLTRDPSGAGWGASVPVGVLGALQAIGALLSSWVRNAVIQTNKLTRASTRTSTSQSSGRRRG